MSFLWHETLLISNQECSLIGKTLGFNPNINGSSPFILESIICKVM